MHESQALDREQVKLLVRNNLRLDWRGASNPFDALRSTRGRFSPLLIVLVINMFFSALISAGFFILPSFFDGLVIGGIGALVLIGLQVVIEFSQILISPDDYYVIAPHPVTSKTFYTAKLIHLLIYVSILSGSLSIVPSVVAIFSTKSIFALPVVILHFWLVGVFATVVMMVFFTLALRSVNRRRMERLMSYLQVGLILILYAGFYLLPEYLRKTLSGVDAFHDPWLAALPTYWFAAPVRLVTQGYDLNTLLLMLLGFGLLIGLGKLALSYLSLNYAQSLTGSVETENVRTRTIPLPVRKLWYRITKPETRAIAQLAWAQFKHDNSFRIQVLWVIPFTLFAIVYGAVKGLQAVDPLHIVPHEGDSGGGAFLGFIAIMAPLMTHIAMTQTKAWRAAWVFHATPLDRAALVMASKRVVLLIVLGPIGLFLTAVYSWLFGNVLHAIMHTFFLVMISWLGLTVAGLASVRVPFATEKAYGSFTAESFVVFTVAWVVMGVPMGVIGELGYGGYLGWLIIVGATALAAFGLTFAQSARIRAKVQSWEF